MSEQLAHSLVELSERGLARGADAVLRGARSRITTRAPHRSRSRSVRPAFAVAAALLLTLGGLMAIQTIRRDPTPTDVPTTTAPPTTTTVPGTGVGAVGAADDVAELAAGSNGSLWAATAAGVVVWDVDAASPTVFTEADGLGGRSVDHVAVGPDGTVWAVGDSWLASYDGTWTLVEGDLPSDRLTPTGDLAVGPDGAAWVASEDGMLFRVDDGGTTTFEVPERFRFFTEPWARSVAVDSTGTVWAAMWQSGVIAFDGQWQHFGVDDGLPSDVVGNITVGPDGSVWVGGDGLYGEPGGDVPAGGILRYRDGTWTTYTTADGLLGNDGDVTIDPTGGVWVVHHALPDDVAEALGVELPEGISHFDGSEWRQYAGVDGRGPGVASADGTLWLPSTQGIAGFDGTVTTHLTVGPERAPTATAAETVRLEPAEGLEPVRLSTSIGEIEFTTWIPPDQDEPPSGLTEFEDEFAASFGDVGFVSSTDGVTWTPAPEPDDRIGPTATGPQGAVTIDGERVDYSDGTQYAEASRPPDKSIRPGDSARCEPPGWRSEGIMPSLGPVVATENGFVVLAARSEADWYNTPVCEPIAWLSTDGDVWIPATDESPFGERAFVVDMVAVGGRVVAVGGLSADVFDEPSGDAALWVSDDGIAWERADLEAAQLWKVAGSARGWIAVGNHISNLTADLRGDMWFSADGLVWDGPYERPAGWADGTGLVGVAMLDDLIVGTGERFNVMPDDAAPAGVVVGVFIDE